MNNSFRDCALISREMFSWRKTMKIKLLERVCALRIYFESVTHYHIVMEYNIIFNMVVQLVI